MNTTMLRRCRQLFASEFVPKHVNRHNQRRWVQSIRFLGPKWLLAEPASRESCGPSAAR